MDTITIHIHGWGIQCNATINERSMQVPIQPDS